MDNVFKGFWIDTKEAEPFDCNEFLVRFKYKDNTVYGSTVAWWSSEGWVKMQTADEGAQPDDYLFEDGNIIVTHWADIPL